MKQKPKNIMGGELAPPVMTDRDYHMVVEGQRLPRLDKLPMEVYQKDKPQRQLIRKLSKQQPLEALTQKQRKALQSN